MAEVGSPLTSPVPQVLFSALAVLLLTLGIVSSASFFVYQATSSKASRSLKRELVTAVVSSFFLGFGSLFLLLWTGVFV